VNEGCGVGGWRVKGEGRRKAHEFLLFFSLLALEKKVVIGDVPMGLLTNNIRPVVCGAAPALLARAALLNTTTVTEQFFLARKKKRFPSHL
jgi:hypothetical protein